MGTLFVDKLDPQSGTSLEIGSSGDTITIPSGATITNSGTATGFGESNTPSFYAYSSSSQVINSDSYTLASCETELWDTDSAYDTSNSRFTPQVAGKYFITGMIRFNSGTDFNDNILRIYKNGTNVVQHQQSNFHYECNTVSAIIDLNGSSDYVEIFGYHNSGGNVSNDSGTELNFFQGYKIIE